MFGHISIDTITNRGDGIGCGYNLCVKKGIGYMYTECRSGEVTSELQCRIFRI